MACFCIASLILNVIPLAPSPRPVHRVLDLDLYKRTRELAFRSHDEIVAGWPDEEIRGALAEFVYASDIILDECEIWEKKRFPSEGSV